VTAPTDVLVEQMLGASSETGTEEGHGVAAGAAEDPKLKSEEEARKIITDAQKAAD